ncbi:hypothetical protein [Xenorhabdus nematophila]|nr:hypothetical protein [Xenorhabdus nematophila]
MANTLLMTQAKWVKIPKKLFKNILNAFLERYRFDLPEMATETTKEVKQS